jgi:hypothetical protein
LSQLPQSSLHNHHHWQHNHCHHHYHLLETFTHDASPQACDLCEPVLFHPSRPRPQFSCSWLWWHLLVIPGSWIQGFMLARQSLYHLSHTSSQAAVTSFKEQTWTLLPGFKFWLIPQLISCGSYTLAVTKPVLFSPSLQILIINKTKYVKDLEFLTSRGGEHFINTQDHCPHESLDFIIFFLHETQQVL